MKLKALGFIAFAVIFTFSFSGSVFAASSPNCNQTPVQGVFGRNWLCSYFLNIPVPDTYANNTYALTWVLLPAGTTNYSGITSNWQTTPITLSSFIAGFQTRLFDSSSTIDEAHAAAIIDIMLSKNGPDFGGSVANGISYAQDNWNSWVNLITEYASNTYSGYGVNFNDFVNFANVTQTDGMGVASSDVASCQNTNACLPDIAFQNLGDDPTPDYAVVFNYPGGQFIIKDKCGNLTGDLTPLPSPVPPATVACDSFISSLATPDPNQSFVLKASVRYTPSTAANTAFGPDALTVQLSGPNPFHTISSTTSAPAISNGVATATLNVPATGVSGAFTLNWQVTGSQAPTVSCSDTVNVAYVPYFTVDGGDISAGQGFGNACMDNPAADITGENLDRASSPGNYFGASSRQAAIATGTINQFATDTTNNSPSDLGGSTDGMSADQPSGLAFANSSPDSGPYGGGILGSSTNDWCVPDYVSSVIGSSGSSVPSNPNSPGDYVYRLTGSQTIPSYQLNTGVHLTIIVSGNAYLSGNITYSPYESLTDIPSFTLMTTGGSIYIDSGVTELHGFYVAQPDASGNGGVVFTCATASGVEAKDYATCNNPLVVYGSVSAKQIILGRTDGSLTKSGSVSNVPAEQFVYTPELWLGTMTAPKTSCGTDPNQGACAYQSYTQLPPVL